jgi:hypothetical protein
MEKLKLIIGPAPSELPLEDLIEKLSQERLRVSLALQKAVVAPKKAASKAKAAGPRKPRAKKTMKLKDFNALLKNLGVSV